MLQRKLEYREGTPQSLAEEARRLAKRSPHNSVPQTWPLCESRAVRLTRDMLTEPARKNPLNRYSGVLHGESSWAHVEHVNFGMEGDNYGGYI